MLPFQLKFTCGSATLFGVRLRIPSNTGIPARDASESSIREHILPAYRNQVALSYALMVPIQLLLQEIPTQIYDDAPTMASPAEVFQSGGNTLYPTVCTELSRTFPHLEFLPVVEGRCIERLRKKLHQLATKHSNEVVSGNIEDIGQKIFTEYVDHSKNIGVEGQNAC